MRLIGKIWPGTDTRGNQLMIVQIEDDGPEVVSIHKPKDLFKDLKWYATQRPFNGR